VAPTLAMNLKTARAISSLSGPPPYRGAPALWSSVWDGLASRRRLRHGPGILCEPASSYFAKDLVSSASSRDDLHTAKGRRSGQRTHARSGPDLRQWRAKARLITAVFPRCSAAVASSCAQPEQAMTAAPPPEARSHGAGPERQAPTADGIPQVSRSNCILFPKSRVQNFRKEFLDCVCPTKAEKFPRSCQPLNPC